MAKLVTKETTDTQTLDTDSQDLVKARPGGQKRKESPKTWNRERKKRRKREQSRRESSVAVGCRKRNDNKIVVTPL